MDNSACYKRKVSQWVPAVWRQGVLIPTKDATVGVGNFPDTCLRKPSKCVSSGYAVSLWLNLHHSDATTDFVIFSTVPDAVDGYGMSISYQHKYKLIEMQSINQYFVSSVSVSVSYNTWFHLTYLHQPKNGMSVVYVDGEFIKGVYFGLPKPATVGDKRVSPVIGSREYIFINVFVTLYIFKVNISQISIL